VPFSRCNLGTEQGLIDDRVLRHGESASAAPGHNHERRDIVMPVDASYLACSSLYATDNRDASWGS
jgi:hypothetical protein